MRPFPGAARAASLMFAAVAALLGAPAVAQIPGDPIHLTAVGPVDPQTNFPAWFQDQSGLTLSLCTANNDPAGMCIYDAIDPTAPAFDYQQQIGFNNEAFWWMGDAALAVAPSAECPTCSGALLVLAVEAAFTGTFPNRGDEFTFGRIRIRIDVPYAGLYRVTHPFGVVDFLAEAPGLKVINDTFDVGTFSPDYAGPLTSGIQNFLVWDPIEEAPPGYIGDPAVPHPVKGSALGTNYFRIEYIDGPTDPALVDLDGAGNAFLETADFLVSGRIFDGVAPTPLRVTRTTVTDGRLEVFAVSAPDSAVEVLIPGRTAGVPLASDGLGNFFALAPLLGGEASVQVVARRPGADPSTVSTPVVDVVSVLAADYDVATKTLTVAASSSAGAPLSVAGLGALDTAGVLTVPGLVVPPPAIRVVSARGGEGLAPVQVIVADLTPPPPTAPQAADDAVTTAEDTTASFDVLANDLPGSAALDPATLVVTVPPAHGATTVVGGVVVYSPALDQVGTDSFTYRVQDATGALSNAATVTITLTPVNDAPVAAADNAQTLSGAAVAIPVLGNDTDVDSLVDPASVVVSTPPLHGTAVVLADGRVSYTPAAGYTGPDAFTYTVADQQGARSAPGTVAIVVDPAAVEALTATRARYRADRREWRVLGQTNIITGNLVTAYLGAVADPARRIGAVAPDATGLVDLRTTTSTLVPRAGDRVTLVSATGATASVAVELN